MGSMSFSFILIAFVAAVLVTLPGTHGLKCLTKLPTDEMKPSVNGSMCAVDVYGCVIKATFYDNSSYTLKPGTIMRGCMNVTAGCSMERKAETCKLTTSGTKMYECVLCCTTDNCNSGMIDFMTISGANTVSITMAVLSFTFLAVVKVMQ